MEKILVFLKPEKITGLIFILLLFFMPVLYSYTEPERTNYVPGEKQIWIRKSRVYTSVVDEYFFHTDGAIDVLFGIIERNYFSNDIGILLLVLYYIFASGISKFIHKIWKKIKVGNKKLNFET